MRRITPTEAVARLTGTPLVVMLDIDGTLCDIVEQPDDAAIPCRATVALRALNGIDDGAVQVAFVTGRSVSDAQRMLDVEGALIYGNHGMERLSRTGNIRGPEGWETQETALRGAARELATLTSGFTGAHLEDKRFSLSVHYRGMAMAAFPELDARAREIAARWSLRISNGKRVMNVVPNNGFNKGNAVREIARESGADSLTSSILFVGDDVTDEDGFVALRDVPHATTVRVGTHQADSAAKFAVDTPLQVHEILDLLVAART